MKFPQCNYIHGTYHTLQTDGSEIKRVEKTATGKHGPFYRSSTMHSLKDVRGKTVVRPVRIHACPKCKMVFIVDN